MKFFIVLSCLAVVAYAISPELEEKIKKKIENNAEECKKELGTSDEDTAPMKSHQPPTTEKGKCFLACVAKKFGLQDASGKIDKAASEALIEKVKILDEELYGKMKKALDTCLAKVTDGKDECETALNMYNCGQEQRKEAGIKELDF